MLAARHERPPEASEARPVLARCIVLAADIADAIRTASTAILDMGWVPGNVIDAAAFDHSKPADHDEQACLAEAIERGCSVVLSEHHGP